MGATAERDSEFTACLCPEAADNVPPSRSSILLDIKAALEAAGIEFVGSPTDKPGICLLRRHLEGNRKGGECLTGMDFFHTIELSGIGQSMSVGKRLTSGDASQTVWSESMSHLNAGAILYYDGECPFCRSYVRYLRVQDAVGTLHLVNVRDQEFHGRDEVLLNFDLDEGMLLQLGGAYYHGSACIHMLALLSSRSTLFNRINAFVFRSPKRAQLLYPILRAGRNVALEVLGRGKISS